jgi:hypothetical protein
MSVTGVFRLEILMLLHDAVFIVHISYKSTSHSKMKVV